MGRHTAVRHMIISSGCVCVRVKHKAKPLIRVQKDQVLCSEAQSGTGFLDRIVALQEHEFIIIHHMMLIMHSFDNMVSTTETVLY